MEMTSSPIALLQQPFIADNPEYFNDIVKPEHVWDNPEYFSDVIKPEHNMRHNNANQV